jgi:hypothetical protein
MEAKRNKARKKIAEENEDEPANIRVTRRDVIKKMLTNEDYSRLKKFGLKRLIEKLHNDGKLAYENGKRDEEESDEEESEEEDEEENEYYDENQEENEYENEDQEEVEDTNYIRRTTPVREATYVRPEGERCSRRVAQRYNQISPSRPTTTTKDN